jgi:hypothetical protein
MLFRLIALFLFSTVALTAVSAFQRSRQRLAAPAPFQSPLVAAGTRIPVVYGTWRVRPIMTWLGGVKISPVYVYQPSTLGPFVIGPTQRVQAGYEYAVTAQFVLCWGPAQYRNMIFGEHKALTSQAGSQSVSVPSPDGTHDLTADAVSAGGFAGFGALDLEIFHGGRASNAFFLPNIYGGPGHGGGVGGTITYAMGSRQYGPDPLMEAKLGAGNVPSYADFATVVYDSVVMGESPTPPPIDFIVRGIGGSVGDRMAGPPGNQWLVQDTSAAAILRDALTNRLYGLGLADWEVDTASFDAAHGQLAAEGLGMSCYVGGSSGPPIETFQQLRTECERHAGGILRRNAETFQWEFALLRATTNPSALPHYDESVLSDVEWHRAEPTEVMNSITVEYSDAEAFYQPNTVTLKNDANIAMTGKVRPTKVQYLGITDRKVAWQVCARELKEQSTPLAKGQAKATRALWAARPGDVIRLSNVKHRLDHKIVRILTVDLGLPEDATITITFIEDVFSHPAVARSEYPTEAPTTVPQIQRPQITSLTTSITNGVGTLEFAVLDPEHRTTSVAVATRSGTGAMSAYANLATANPDPTGDKFPFNQQVTDDDLNGTYSQDVSLSSFGDSAISVRLRYVGFSTVDDPLADIQETFASATFPVLRRVGVPVLSFVYSGTDVIVTATAPDATSVKIAGKLGSEPTDTEIRAATADSSAPFQLTLPAPPAGQVLYVDAFAYESANESARSPTLTITGIATTGSRGNTNVIVRDGSGGFVPVLTSSGGTVVV